MKFSEQLYRTKTRLPQPEHFIEPDGSFGVIVSCWGQENSASKAIEHVIQLKNVYAQDREHTSPFSFLDSLSYETNRLRQNLMNLNDYLYAEDNQNEFKNGYEVLIFSRNQNEWSWAQVGGPNIILNRNHQAHVLQASTTAAMRFGTAKNPLPGLLLGLYRTTSIQCGSIRTDDADEIIFYSGDLHISSLDENFLNPPDLKNRVQAVLKNKKDEPFWLASLNYEGV